MFSAIFTFLGGAAFRYIIQRALDWLEKRQEFLQEQKRLEAQERYESLKHARTQETIRLQHELGIQQIQVAGAAASDLEAAKAFTAAMAQATQPSGNGAIDAWNASIRPAAASIALAMWALKLLKQSLVVTQWDMDLATSVLGFYFADRHLGKPRRA